MSDLGPLRDRIAECDRGIAELVARRIAIAEDIGKIKAAAGADVRDREAEAKVVRRYGELAAEFGIDGRAMAEIARTLIEAAVEREAAAPRPTMAPMRILIVGGAGKMGRWLKRFFEERGHTVDAADPALDNGISMEDAPKYDATVVSVPIHLVDGVLSRLGEICPAEELVFDITSLKTPFVKTLWRLAKKGRFCSVHPMFGPSAATMYDRNLIVCDCGNREAAERAKELFDDCGGNITVMPVERHDLFMSYVLGFSHAVNIAYFTVLARSGFTCGELESVASTTYSKMEDTNRSVAMEDPYLYYEIQHLNGNRDTVLIEFDRAVQDVVRAASSDDPAEFGRLMDAGKEYFSGKGERPPPGGPGGTPGDPRPR